LSKVLTVNYNDAVPKAVINNGAQIQVQFPSNGADTITLGGQVYDLSQFHYHDPSENLVNGKAATMEEHFVNVSASGAETVLAVFLQLGAHNDALDPILNAAMTSLTSPNTSTTIPTAINFAGLLPQSKTGWYYQGSLTTPPLSQPVNWLVFSTPITLDFQQLKEYEDVAGGSGFLPNARPVQPTDGRQVNEIDYDVNFQGQSVAGLNFAIAPASAV
jgi:carbonic anhydrase